MGFRSTAINTAALARDAEVCCILDSSLQFLYCNPAWDDFAMANGGTGEVLARSLIHQSLLAYMPDILKPFFTKHLNSLRERGGMWHHRYQCCSQTHFRAFELQAIRLPGEDQILMCHSLICCRPHTRQPIEPRKGVLGEVRMCCHCRRTRPEDGRRNWDWIPEYVAHPPQIWVADLCPSCADYYRSGGDVTRQP